MAVDTEMIREVMRELGRRSSERKAKACRLNARQSWTPQAREKRALGKAKRDSNVK